MEPQGGGGFEPGGGGSACGSTILGSSRTGKPSVVKAFRMTAMSVLASSKTTVTVSVLMLISEDTTPGTLRGMAAASAAADIQVMPSTTNLAFLSSAEAPEQWMVAMATAAARRPIRFTCAPFSMARQPTP